ncbi:MAG: beta-N-acetylglucosaminidase [Bacteroidia bacterium]|nr:beta-N-acetylglucosaminidase [Bacteroidia bacterium]
MHLRQLFFAALFLISLSSIGKNTLIIQPTPQSVELKSGEIEKPAAVRLIGKTTADAHAVNLLQTFFTEGTAKKDFAVYMGERGNRDLRRYAARIPARAEGYYLAIENDKIIIAGNDKRGTYYAVRTLQQIMEQSQNLPLLEITDYPDVAARGVVEGFYGTPWSFEDRISLLNFFGENKLNTYIYGPKDDPYHGFGEKWRVPYPEKEAQAIKKLLQKAEDNHVDFVWAIHPGRDIKWNAEDRDFLMKKFESMYQLGVRAFAVFFDDISGEGTNPEKQAELLNYVDNNFVQKKKDVLPLILCPTEYNKSWSNIERGYLPTLGKNLNPSIHTMWTGDRVISDITVDGLQWINNHIRREAYIWWNFPVSDYVRDHLLMGPAYGLDTDAGNLMSGFMTNPMERAEASKIAIYSVADYAWNTQNYEPMHAWERAIKNIMPSDADALRIFAHHNADLGANGHGYRRDESWEFKETANEYLQNIRNNQTDLNNTLKVQEEFANILYASNILMQNQDNPALVKEIAPWLKQFRLLGESGLVLLSLEQAFANKNKSRFDALYGYMKQLKEQMHEISNTHNQNPYQPGVKTGTLVLEPLIDSTLLVLADRYAETYGTTLPRLADYTPHLLFSNVEQVKDTPVRFLRKNITINPLLEVVKIPAGGYIGLELVPAQKIASARINTGLEQFPAWIAVQLSTDGVNWTPYNGKPNNQNVWIGGKSESAYRFIRLINTSENEQEMYLRQFEVKVE